MGVDGYVGNIIYFSGLHETHAANNVFAGNEACTSSMDLRGYAPS